MKMTYMVILTVSAAILLAGGCQEEQATPGEKMARLTAAENRNLQTQLQAGTKKKDDEIKKISEQLEKAQSSNNAEITKRDGEIKKLSEQLQKAQASSQAEITRRDDEIKQLNTKLQAEIKKRDEDVRNVSRQLEQCESVNNERMAKIIDKECQETVSKLLDWTAELSAEIERLKTGQAGGN